MEEFNPAYLPLYKNMMDSLRLLKQKDVCSFLEGADTYYRTGVVIDMTYTAKILFTSVKYAFDESEKSYFDKVSAGKKSAEAKKKKASTKQQSEEEVGTVVIEEKIKAVETLPLAEIQQNATEVQQKSAEVVSIEVQENRPPSFSQQSPTNLKEEPIGNGVYGSPVIEILSERAQPYEKYYEMSTADCIANQQTSTEVNRRNKEKEEEKEKEKEKEKRESVGRGTVDESFCQQVGLPPSGFNSKNESDLNSKNKSELNTKKNSELNTKNNSELNTKNNSDLNIKNNSELNTKNKGCVSPVYWF